MNPFRRSIRRQLLLWLLIPLTGLWLVFGVLTYFLAIDLTTFAYDRALADSARYVLSRLRVEGDKVVLDFPAEAQAVFRDDPKDIVYYQVLSADGRLMGGDAQVPKPADDEWDAGDEFSHEPLYHTTMVNGQPVRSAAVRWAVPNKPGQFLLVQVAETLKERNSLETRILITILIPEILTLLLAATTIWFGVRQGLAPLKIVQDAVASRSQSDLRPLKEDSAPKEVRPLVRAINDLLRRLERDIDAQRRFVANAAHQLRTPLAGLKTQTQLALRDSELTQSSPFLEKIHTSADRCAHLVNQLLILAKIEPGVTSQQTHTVLDINTVARNASQDLVGDALARGTDLGFEACPGAPLIKGDPHALHELTCNLVENAIRYTQPGGKVTVQVVVDYTVNLVVEDNGPGIPVEEREKVFERFYRVLGTGVSGSGLGLSIVSEIAATHDAEISIDAGPGGVGTLVTVRFPAVQKNIQPPPAEALAAGNTAQATAAAAYDPAESPATTT